MRKLLMLGLCLALALQGAAQASVVEKACPIGQIGHPLATGAFHKTPACCNDADTAAKTGKICKTGQACPAAGAWLVSSTPSCSFLPLAAPLVRSPQPFALCVDPRGRWRPPALS
ncbi:MAG TPA: hypothetical protein VH183_07845 [Burkholderiaceae bacterium]|nr:hypothetical protein [Burkholderiaceae bacterium]